VLALNAATGTAATATIFKGELAQLWHVDKEDMSSGKGAPTVRMMCQPASQVGHRYLGVRKKGEPGNQCWYALVNRAIDAD
jgi:hypothetical protein